MFERTEIVIVHIIIVYIIYIAINTKTKLYFSVIFLHPKQTKPQTKYGTYK